ncbi:hypothetical protein TeGR_g14646 [Tetraparma gracilis]|uniref:TIR domain-containing protein n=1 Tax=Tetraparma gracilis TaxID=2962635 RepID=A0ABQ6MB64_9STRA|nr:hypothetical protein TeGR_g14646 [Tetraparma gracilis]
MASLVSSTAPAASKKKGELNEQHQSTAGASTAPAASKKKGKKKPPPLRPARPHNLLLSYISTDTDLGRKVLEAIEDQGYVVLPSVLGGEECDEELDRLWDFVEKTSPSVKRGQPDTHYPDGPGAPDPWPHSGWGNLPDMCQSYSGGWLFSNLREKLAARVFEPLYGTRQLHSSKEVRRALVRPSKARERGG